MPIYRLVAGFPITQATALSLATISGGSIANLYTRRYHPNEALKRPLIDYEASLLFCPASWRAPCSAPFSVSCSRPGSRSSCSIALLGYSGKTLNKGIKRWKGDSKQGGSCRAADARRGGTRRRRGRHAPWACRCASHTTSRADA